MRRRRAILRRPRPAELEKAEEWRLSKRREDPRVGYIDSVDFDYELGEAPGGTVIYESAEDARRERPCMRDHGCGIYKVEIRFAEVVQEEDLKFFGTEAPGLQVSGHFRGKQG